MGEIAPAVRLFLGSVAASPRLAWKQLNQRYPTNSDGAQLTYCRPDNLLIKLLGPQESDRNYENLAVINHLRAGSYRIHPCRTTPSVVTGTSVRLCHSPISPWSSLKSPLLIVVFSPRSSNRIQAVFIGVVFGAKYSVCEPLVTPRKTMLTRV